MRKVVMGVVTPFNVRLDEEEIYQKGDFIRVHSI